MTAQTITIGFIGGGNMSESFIGGLYNDQRYQMKVSEPYDPRREYMEKKYTKIPFYNNNQQLFTDGTTPQVIILAVKPQVMKEVLIDLQPTLEHIQTKPLFLSIAAGINTQSMLSWLKQPTLPLIRLMPNTPALIGEGAVGCFPANDYVTKDHKELSDSILSAISKEIAWVDNENTIDTVTGVSGSGPAYFFLVMEAIQNAGEAAGLSPKDAKALVLQTCLGAAKMAMESEDDLATLRKKVTSPKGTTEAALKVMEANNIRQIINDGVFAAIERGRELSEEFGKE
ncbi:unnamed protein product [Cunninghamella blakesleeana]